MTTTKAALKFLQANYSPKTIRAILKYGIGKCSQAYVMNVKEGEGGYYISLQLDIHLNATSAAIAAGEEIAKKGAEIAKRAEQIIALGAAK